MSPFDSKIQNLQMSPNIFFCASSYSFRNITILNYWRLERWWRSLRTIFENIFSNFVDNGELLTMNFEYSASIWMKATHTHTHTHSHTHARAYIHKQGIALHILVSGISSEGVVYHHSDAFPDVATARVHVTLWKIV